MDRIVGTIFFTEPMTTENQATENLRLSEVEKDAVNEESTWSHWLHLETKYQESGRVYRITGEELHKYVA